MAIASLNKISWHIILYKLQLQTNYMGTPMLILCLIGKSMFGVKIKYTWMTFPLINYTVKIGTSIQK